MVQWLRIYLPRQRAQVQSLVWALRSHMPCSQNFKLKKKKPQLRWYYMRKDPFYARTLNREL